ncbi:Nramp family divalent metal transporter [Streptomyces sp. NPDC056821]|uniref:Nramp family divalent metal transporter n=1 Tax=unclassified Streptomyces TaxID=2593676 RepID=UPI0036C3929B
MEDDETRLLAVGRWRNRPAMNVAPSTYAEPAPRGQAIRRSPGRQSRRIPFALGPAFIAAIAYVDPGNVATNVLAGARYGYLLLWVVAGASLLGMLVQYLSAKLGTATGQSLPEICRRYPDWVRIGLWAQAELVVIMTDLAEFVGGAIALHMLFGMPLPVGGAVMVVAVLAVFAVQVRGRTSFRGVVIASLAVIVAAVGYQAVRASVSSTSVLDGLVPRIAGNDSVLLAAGIVGATVMPHAIYLHSGLSQELREARPKAPAAALLSWNRRDVLIAMTLAGVVNAAILVSATVLDGPSGESLPDAYRGFAIALGSVSALVFPVALLASSLASSLVGVYSGQVIMQGFLRRSIPLWVRRAVSAVPPLVILVVGVDATQALVVSQVVLSFGIPFALIPLILFTRDRKLMGSMVNRKVTTAVSGLVAALVIALNVFLLVMSG